MKKIGTEEPDKGNLYVWVYGEGTSKPVPLSGSMFSEIPNSVFNVLKMGNKSKTHTSWRKKLEKTKQRRCNAQVSPAKTP